MYLIVLGLAHLAINNITSGDSTELHVHALFLHLYSVRALVSRIDTLIRTFCDLFSCLSGMVCLLPASGRDFLHAGLLLLF
jgi:hypothetical protein